MSTTNAGKQTIVHWFRKGQRIHDNPPLKKACALVNANPEKYVLRPIFILDPGIPRWMTVGANRFRFLQESLVQFNDNLKAINSRLYVVRGTPSDVFPRLFEEWRVKVLTFESDIEPYAKKRDAEVRKLADECDVEVIVENSHTIYDPYKVLMLNSGRPIINYRSFQAVIAKLPAAEPVPTPDPIKCSPPLKDFIEEKNGVCYDVPSLEQIGVDVNSLGPSKFPGGETEALSRMEHHLKNTEWICSFEEPNTFPNSLEPSTTVLSPYLKFGCLSSRLFYK
ncbi:unnamed protein product [Hermetia illucens]|uniref:Photolyase/cryptochrome alpha/beta domain-containing protein n=2 Tax=Hermetia illucens TaxID=343691 RepID=A0A7R8UF65_HERIL|nr:unnamed protein product [Hermetia illucens]